MGALRLVELEGSRDGVEHGGRGGLEATLLQPRVVVDADARELRHFFATKSRHPATGSSESSPRLLRTQPGASALEELSRLGLAVHMRSIWPERWGLFPDPEKSDLSQLLCNARHSMHKSRSWRWPLGAATVPREGLGIMGSLQGKPVIITGAGSGMGAATAKRAFAEGASDRRRRPEQGGARRTPGGARRRIAGAGRADGRHRPGADRGPGRRGGGAVRHALRPGQLRRHHLRGVAPRRRPRRAGASHGRQRRRHAERQPRLRSKAGRRRGLRGRS